MSHGQQNSSQQACEQQRCSQQGQQGRSQQNSSQRANEKTHQVLVGNAAFRAQGRAVPLGGGAPVVVQSMLNAPAHSAAQNLAQIEELAQAGCEVVRMAVPHVNCLEAFQEVCEKSPLPVVADVHFDARIAIGAAQCGAAKLRINPGNIGGFEKTADVIAAAREAGIPIRVGVNAGSLDSALATRADVTLPEKLAQSAADYVAFFESQNFYDVVVSAKAHDVVATIETYRLLSQRIPQVPLHIGITEAGTLFQGIIKSAAGLGILLEQGIGDTLRISLTDEPVQEVRACWALLGALGLRARGVEIISCPTCGRTQVNLIPLARAVQERLVSIEQPLKVAVMGCVVNGPGEATDADIGVACGKGEGIIFAHGEKLRKVPEDEILDALVEEISNL